jgi:hypothetical protein
MMRARSAPWVMGRHKGVSLLLRANTIVGIIKRTMAIVVR